MKKIYFLLLLLFTLNTTFAQITLINSFNPAGISSLCGLGYDPFNSQVWVYACNSDSIKCYSPAGVLLKTIAVAGENANDVDIEVSEVPFQMNGQSYPQGQLLFFNGETDSAETYVLDNINGTVLDTLHSRFGNSHVVGGAYHPARNTFFMVQDNVPGATLENLIAEINPLTGDTLQVFQITNYFNVSYGDIEVGGNGNLFVVSSVEDSIAEFTPQGAFVQQHGLPSGVSDLSGIGLDCLTGDAWVTSNSGTVYHLSQFPCGSTGIEEIALSYFSISDIKPNPFTTELSFSITMKKEDKLKVTLCDVLGQAIEIIFDGIGKKGKNDFILNNQLLKDGLYFLKTESHFKTETKRIISLK